MTDEEIRLERYIYAVWRAKWLILLGAFLAAAVAAGWGLTRPTSYTASALIKIGKVWKEPLEDPYVTAEIANSPGFVSELAVATGSKPGYLRRSLQAEAVTAGPPRNVYPILVKITASADRPDEPAKLAKDMAEALIARHKKNYDEALAAHLELQQRLEKRYDAEMKHSDGRAAPSDISLKIERELDEVKTANSSPTQTEMTHLAGDVVSASAPKPPVARNAIAAALIAGVACIGIAAVSALFSRPQPSSTPSAQSHPDVEST